MRMRLFAASPGYYGLLWLLVATGWSLSSVDCQRHERHQVEVEYALYNVPQFQVSIQTTDPEESSSLERASQQIQTTTETYLEIFIKRYLQLHRKEEILLVNHKLHTVDLFVSVAPLRRSSSSDPMTFWMDAKLYGTASFAASSRTDQPEPTGPEGEAFLLRMLQEAFDAGSLPDYQARLKANAETLLSNLNQVTVSTSIKETVYGPSVEPSNKWSRAAITMVCLMLAFLLSAIGVFIVYVRRMERRRNGQPLSYKEGELDFGASSIPSKPPVFFRDFPRHDGTPCLMFTAQDWSDDDDEQESSKPPSRVESRDSMDRYDAVPEHLSEDANTGYNDESPRDDADGDFRKTLERHFEMRALHFQERERMSQQLPTLSPSTPTEQSSIKGGEPFVMVTPESIV